MEKPNIEDMLGASEALNGDAPDEVVVDENVLAAEIITEGDEPAVDVVDEVAEEVIAEEATDEVAVEAVEEVDIPVFAAESPALIEQAQGIAEKYEIPADLQAAITAMSTKLAEVPVNDFSDYGEPDDVRGVLDKYNYLNSDRPRQDGNGSRPNTDKFIEGVAPERLAWLFHDLGSMPSSTYQGLTMAQERIVSEYGLVGESVPDVLSRYETFTRAMQTGVMQTDVPEFVPVEMHEAYNKLSENRRLAIAGLDVDDDVDDIAESLKELGLIQSGLDGKRGEAKYLQERQQQNEQKFNELVNTKTTAFFNTFREQFTTKLTSEVKFSDDAKLQGMYATQNIALLTAAMDEGSAGDWARISLKSAGIEFDGARVQTLLNAIENSAITITSHELAKTNDGKQLDQVALNKAVSDFKRNTQAFNDFSENVIKQMAKITNNKVDEPKKETVKARITPKGVATAAKKPILSINPTDPNRHVKFADALLAEQAKKARFYQNA